MEGRRPMESIRRRFLAVCLSLIMLFCAAVPAQAAYPYSVKVQNNSVLFIRNGKTEGRYPVNSTSLTLMSKSGELLVCFYNSQNVYKYITLGKQNSLTISGAMKSLSLSSSLSKNVKVTVGAGSNISSMQISSASNNVNIQGKVGTMTVSAAAKVSVLKGASVDNAKLLSSSAKLTASSGSSVDYVQAVNRSSISGSGIGTIKIGSKTSIAGSSSSLRLTSTTIYADYGERLRDLTYDLADNVNATVGGRSISGTVSWVSPTSTILKKSGSYQYLFKSNNNSYGSKRGTIRIIVDNEYDDYDDDIDLDIDSFTVSSSTKRLSSYTSKLNSHVKAYNDNGNRISGKAVWVLDSTRVDETDYYPFIFIPSSSRYSRVRDEIRIYVEDDYDDDDDDDDESDVRLETNSFHADDGDRLYHYQNDLEDNVKAYNSSGKRIYGDVEWRDDDERISGDGYYRFTFYPDDSDYDDTDGKIKIYAD